MDLHIGDKITVRVTRDDVAKGTVTGTGTNKGRPVVFYDVYVTGPSHWTYLPDIESVNGEPPTVKWKLS